MKKPFKNMRIFATH